MDHANKDLLHQMTQDTNVPNDVADHGDAAIILPCNPRATESMPLLSRGISSASIMGSIRLTDSDLIYVPRATADPRDPLNMKPWQKIVVVVVVSSFSAISLSFIGGFGGVISFYIPKYLADGNSYATITYLMTYPTLSMGLGNLIGMPVALAVGRRSVMLTATAILMLGTILCAASNSLSMHLVARMLIGLAAGQSESIVPLIVQTVQVIISAIWMLCASPISDRLSPAWWYGLGAVVAGIQLIVSVFFLPETKYDRGGNSSSGTGLESSMICSKRPPLDLINFKPRNRRYDMRLWNHAPEWTQGAEVLREVLQLFCVPNVIWVAVLSGATLGVNISIATTYSNILTNPPYSWSDHNVSYANFGQIPIALICFPILGAAADRISQWRARKNSGLHEPESRLLLLAIPITLGVGCCFLYGHAASHPLQYHWIYFPAILAGYFFAFVGTNIICITYLFDCYPTRAGSLLIFVGCSRGILSWIISSNVAYLIDSMGYYLTFLAFGALTAFLGFWTLPFLLFGTQIRRLASGRIHETKVRA